MPRHRTLLKLPARAARAALVTPALLTVACADPTRPPGAPSRDTRPVPQVTALEGADLALTKVADRKQVRIGDNITFTITLTNLGPEAATSVVFGDPLADPLNLVSFSCSQGTPTGGSFCAVSSVPNGGSVTATLVATPITNPAQRERKFSNTAFVSASATADPDASNNSASLVLHITGPIP
jgi:uncharacterized repeat protein (TIGR01451 family)